MPFYIYRHIRPDTNQVFYIGKGNNLDKRKSEYRRAFETLKRSDFWTKVYNKNNKQIVIEIIFECSDEKKVNEKEMEFISIYGRKDLNQGTLVNLTCGGDGSLGYIISEENRQKKREIGSPMQGKKHKAETLLKLSESAKKRTSPNPFKGKTHSDKTKALLSKLAKEKPHKKKHKFINVNTKEIFNGMEAASNSIGIHKTSLIRNLKNNYENNLSPIVRYDDYISGKIIANKEGCKIPKNRKEVVDVTSGEIYQSVKEAARIFQVDVSTLRRRLNGIFNNNTTLKYKDA